MRAKWTRDQVSHTALALAKSANCNEDQPDIVAVATSALCRTHTGDEAAQRVVIIHGACGAGKTHVINKVARPLARKIFGPAGERAVAVPNSAARILSEGATRIHAAPHATHQQRLESRSLSATTRKGALSQKWYRANLLIIDEMSMVPPTWLNAPSFSISLARKTKHGSSLTTYP